MCPRTAVFEDRSDHTPIQTNLLYINSNRKSSVDVCQLCSLGWWVGWAQGWFFSGGVVIPQQEGEILQGGIGQHNVM